MSSCRLLALSFAFFLLALPAVAERVSVFAAASLSGVLEEIATRFEQETGTQVVLTVAGTSALARQILQGAPADVFISANSDWMDAVQAQGRLVPETRFDLASNRLVLIARGTEGTPVDLMDADELVQRLNGRRLAMALVDAVPAGIYGKASLRTLGLWSRIEAQVAQTDNVRAALALVAVGAAPYGIVYASDVKAEPRVHVAAEFAADTHPPIRYPVASVAGRGGEAAEAFMAFLKGDVAQSVLRAHGFLPVGD